MAPSSKHIIIETTAAQLTQQDKQLLAAMLDDNVDKFASLLNTDIRFDGFSNYQLLCESIKHNRPRIATYLLDNGCCVFKPDSTVLPLHLAMQHISECCCDWTDVLVKILKAGAQISDVNANGDTALHAAFNAGVEAGLIDVLMKVYMEECGEDLVSKDGLSVLHVACAGSKIEFVRELLDKQVDLNRQIPHYLNMEYAGYTPLHIAVAHNNYEIAEFLLKRGAEIYKYNLEGSTPLHLACYCRNVKMIDLILAYDRNTANVVDNNGLSHFMVACTSSESAFAKEHLRVAECRPWTSSKTLISSCVKKVANCQFAGYTPLIFAAEFGNREIFDLLLARGAWCSAITTQLCTHADKLKKENVGRLKDEILSVKDFAIDKSVKNVDECVSEKTAAMNKKVSEKNSKEKSKAPNVTITRVLGGKAPRKTFPELPRVSIYKRTGTQTSRVARYDPNGLLLLVKEQ